MVRHVGFLAMLILGTQIATAQGLFEGSASEPARATEEVKSIELGGYARGAAYGGGEAYDYSSLFGEFVLKGRLSEGKAFLFGDIRFRAGKIFDQSQTDLQLKEVYAGFKGKKIDVFLGNQIVVWGRTDGFNPTNNLHPNDYFFLTPDPDDQKLSNFMLRAKIRFTPQMELDMIAIPYYRPSVYRYDLFDMNEGTRFLDMTLPAANFRNSGLAARLNFELPGAGFSSSYFHGYDPFYGYTIDSLNLSPALDIQLRPSAYKKDVFGADFSVPLSTWIVQGEAALTFTKNYEAAMHIPNPDLYYVLALEHDVNGYLAILQYIGKYTLDYKELVALVIPTPVEPTDPYYMAYLISLMQYGSGLVYYESALFNRKIFRQQEKTNHALMLSVSKSFAYETIRAELSCYYNFTSKEYLIRPDLKWKTSDALSISLGGSIMKGPKDTVYDRAGKVLNGAYVGMTVTF
ncbi:MAG: hypothetical protein Q8M23_04675 [Bacteroidales bacterium]|nr:hypothetical protein [Bacteroidales bacterium]